MSCNALTGLPNEMSYKQWNGCALVWQIMCNGAEKYLNVVAKCELVSKDRPATITLRFRDTLKVKCSTASLTKNWCFFHIARKSSNTIFKIHQKVHGQSKRKYEADVWYKLCQHFEWLWWNFESQFCVVTRLTWLIANRRPMSTTHKTMNLWTPTKNICFFRKIMSMKIFLRDSKLCRSRLSLDTFLIAATGKTAPNLQWFKALKSVI